MIRAKMRRGFPTRFLRTLIFVTGAVVLVAGSAVAMWPAPARERFGVDTLIALAAADRAEIVRLQPSPELSGDLGAPVTDLPSARDRERGSARQRRGPARKRRKRTLEAWMTSTPKTVEADWRRKVQRLLGRRDSFRWDIAPACIPMPGVAIRFSGGQEPVDVLVCFSCGMISVAPPGRPRWGYGATCSKQLLALVRQQFPYDPDLAEAEQRFP